MHRIVARRRAPLVLTALVAVAIAAPLGAFASHQFTDVPDSNPFHTDIDALADSGVTTGCGGTNYCPSAFVTREQMAAFMNRLGALSPSKTPVVNADKLDGIDSTGFVQAGDTIVMRQINGWTLGANLTSILSSDGLTVTGTTLGNKSISLGLVGPASVGGSDYVLQEATVCVKGNANVTLSNVILHAVVDTASAESDVSTQDTVLSSPHCRTVTDDTLNAADGASWLMVVVLDFAAVTQATLGTVTTTWVPAAG